jgi:predicted enzyme related to lactoylglutathione lyase
MPDPFEILRAPIVPIAPDPTFADRLRTRIERGLALPRGVTVSDAVIDPPAPESFVPGDVGYVSLWVPDVERAAAFFAAVLGWSYAPGSGPQGRQVTGQSLHHGLWGGQDRSTLFLCYVVDDVDQAVERVRAAGGQADAPTEEPYGRVANCIDNQGTAFAVFRPPAGEAGEPGGRPPANGRGHGDLAYITCLVRDSTRARDFYGAVLGWRFSLGRAEDGWGVEDIVPMTGMQGGHAEGTGVPMYRVDDIAAAVHRVRAAGGSATDPDRQPYGITSDCTDDQGTHFYLGQM